GDLDRFGVIAALDETFERREQRRGPRLRRRLLAVPSHEVPGDFRWFVQSVAEFDESVAARCVPAFTGFGKDTQTLFTLIELVCEDRSQASVHAARLFGVALYGHEPLHELGHELPLLVLLGQSAQSLCRVEVTRIGLVNER